MNLDNETLRSVMLPALAGAAGTGAVGAYMSSKSHPDGELPAQRRRRILRNALLSAGLGGVTGAALPAGLKMLTNPYIGSGFASGPTLTDKATNLAVGNALPLGVLGGGGALALGASKREGDAALKHILRITSGEVKDPKITSLLGSKNRLHDVAQVRQLMTSEPGVQHLLSRLAGSDPRKGVPIESVFRGAEMIGAAGGPKLTGQDLLKFIQAKGLNIAKGPEAMTRPTTDINALRQAYARYVTGESSVLGPLSKVLGGAKSLAGKSGLGGQMPAWVTDNARKATGMGAELYSRYLRPGATRMLGSKFGPLGRMGLLGGGVTMAHMLQNKLEGK